MLLERQHETAIFIMTHFDCIGLSVREEADLVGMRDVTEPFPGPMEQLLLGLDGRLFPPDFPVTVITTFTS